MNRKRINVRPYIIAVSISVVIYFAIAIVFWCVRGVNLSSSLEGSGYSSIVLLSAGGLIYVVRNGFFDFASYGFRQMGAQLFSKDPREFHDFAQYKIDKRTIRERRSNYYLAILAVGFLLLIVSIILLIALPNA